MLSEYLCVGGLEVGNNARARGYAESADCPVGWFVGDQCETLADALGDAGKYTLDQIADAPWYDPDDEATTRFYGYYVTSLGEVSSSTRQGSFTEGILPGGVPGRSRHAGRTFRVRAWLTANGQDALEAGQSWLDAALEANNCSTHPGGSCGATDATFFTACPPARKTIPGFSPWRQVAENLFPNPNLVGDGSRVTVWENLFTNPGFETAQTGSTTIPAQTIYRNDLSAPTTTGWTASLVAANGSGATGASVALQGAAGTRVVRAQTDGATTSVNPTAAVRMTMALTTVVGVQYTVAYQYKAVSSACLVRVSLGTAQGPETSSNILAAGTPVVFTATSTTTTLAFDVYDNPASTGTRDSVYGELGDVTVTQAAYTVPTAPVEARRNEALNPRQVASGNLTEAQGRYSGQWTRSFMTSITPPTPGLDTGVRLTATAAVNAAGYGFDWYGNADLASPAAGWGGPTVSPGQVVTIRAWGRSNRSIPSMSIGVRFYDGTALTWIGAMGAVQVASVGGQWSLVTATVTVPAGANKFVVRGISNWQPFAFNVGDTIDQSGLYIGINDAGPYFDGMMQSTPDSDLTPAWAGAANASASVLNGTAIAGISAVPSRASVVRSAQWAETGAYSARVMPNGSTNSTYAEVPISGLVAGQTYTVIGTIRIPAVQTGSLHAMARAFWPIGGGDPVVTYSKTAPNQVGVFEVRGTFVAGSGTSAVRFMNGSQQRGADVWWDSGAVIPGVYAGPWFDGSHPLDDDDFQTAWVGTADASISRVTGEAIPFVPSIPDRCIAIRSSRTDDGVTYPLRLIAKRSSNDTFVNVTLPASTMASGTIMGTRLQDAPIPGIIDRALWVGTPAQQVPPVNVAGSQAYRLAYSGLTANGGARYYHGGAWGTPDVWWTMPGIFVGPYDGEWFAGDTYPEAADSLARTRWAGAANASVSTMDTRTPQSRLETDEEYEEALIPLVRHVHDVICISGPLEVETRISKDKKHWGRLVEFTLYAGKPWLYGETKRLELSPTPATVVQDLPFNLVQTPSAEIAGGVITVARNYSLNPSLETDATGWSPITSVVSGDDPASRTTSGRVTAELAAAGIASMRMRLLGNATAGAGRSLFSLTQMVDISTRVPGARVSATVWAALINVGAATGTTLHGLRAYCDWYNASNVVIGSVTLGNSTDPSSFGGRVFSQKSMLPPAGTAKALITVTGEFTWTSGTNQSDIRLYADALGVTVP